MRAPAAKHRRPYARKPSRSGAAGRLSKSERLRADYGLGAGEVSVVVVVVSVVVAGDIVVVAGDIMVVGGVVVVTGGTVVVVVVAGLVIVAGDGDGVVVVVLTEVRSSHAASSAALARMQMVCLIIG
jgi:hypothetical protein